MSFKNPLSQVSKGSCSVLCHHKIFKKGEIFQYRITKIKRMNAEN